MDKISNNALVNSSRSNDENQLMEFIRQYSERANEHKTNADLSCELLQIGTKTEFAQKLEEVLLNPIGAITEIKKKVDNEVLSVVDNLFKLFILKAKEDNLINAAFRNGRTYNEIKYGIVLKEDSFEARTAVFSFLNFYSTLDLAEQVHVYFQFIPEELTEKISNKEYIA
ncbi:MAG: hypothetical protein WKG06_14765 [Segetibacter sp.]